MENNYNNVAGNRNIRKQFLLSEADNEKLKVLSETKNMSQNEIVNKALTMYLNKFKKLFSDAS